MEDTLPKDEKPRASALLEHTDIIHPIFKYFIPLQLHPQRALIPQLQLRAGWRKELLNLALVCKAFHGPAIDCLWSHLDSLTPLLKLHPGLRVVNGSYFFLGNIWPSLGDVEDPKASVFHHCARAVRSITLKAGEDKTLPLSLAGIAWLGQQLKGVPLMPGLRRICFSDPKSDTVYMGLLPLVLSPSIETVEFTGAFLSEDIFNSYALPLVCSTVRSIRHLTLHDENTVSHPALWESLPTELAKLQLQSLTLRFPNNPTLTPAFLSQIGRNLEHLTSLTLDIHTPSHGPSAEELSKVLFPSLTTLELVNRSNCNVCQCYPRFLLQKATSMSFHLSTNALENDTFAATVETLSTVQPLREVRMHGNFTINVGPLLPFLRTLNLESFRLDNAHIGVEDSNGQDVTQLIDAAYDDDGQKRKRCLQEFTTPLRVWNNAVGDIGISISSLVHIARHARGLQRISLTLNSAAYGSDHKTLASIIDSWVAPDTPSTIIHLDIYDRRSKSTFTSADFTSAECRDLARLLDTIFPELESLTMMKGRPVTQWDEDWETIEENRRMRKALRISGRSVEDYRTTERTW
ncbi:hypothetical protein D9611_003014 [Ephemerocybe angulata]|uniref:Uncharacterized protein n=1 Tax=Ephemerocybe angulata TaxID=980116 RepID=A0A8H5C8R7_9AGAR|nr:hypothetical protein D9611_003014 [Tulosesus angulatus]